MTVAVLLYLFFVEIRNIIRTATVMERILLQIADVLHYL